LHEQLAQHLHSSKPKGHPPTPRGTWRNLAETRRGVRKGGVLEHKRPMWVHNRTVWRESGNISETHTNRRKVTMEGLQKLTNALSNGAIPTPTACSSPRSGVHNPHPKLQSLLFQERVILYEHSQDGSEQKPVKISRKVAVGVLTDSRKYPGHP